MILREIKTPIIWLVFGLLILSLPNFGLAQDSTSASFTVEDPVVDTGFESSTSTNFGLGQSLSQVAIGKSTSASFELWSGFQYFFQVDANTLTATAGDGEVDLNWTTPTTYLGITVGSYEVGTGVVSGSYTFENVGLVTNFTKSGLTNGTPYFFIIKALSPIGTFLVFSNEDTATPTGAAPPSGGGGGGIIVPLIVSGQTFPNATITLVRDAVNTTTVMANSSGQFNINLTGLPPGTYNFLLYATDPNGLRTANLNFQATVVATTTTRVENLLVSPTITTDYSIIKQGDNIKISGYAPANSPVTIRLASDFGSQTFNTTSNAQGYYEYILNTAGMPFGQYDAYSYAVFGGRQTPNSLTVSFGVSDRSVPREEPVCGKRSDFNCDGYVNLIDFSIMMFYWEGAADISGNPRVDTDGSGVVDLVDFSILLYDWTG